MLIDVKKASVNTATVEVKSLTIDGKQVTLSVFRQLEQAYSGPVDFDSGAAQPIWGWVNYFWPGCDAHSGHAEVCRELANGTYYEKAADTPEEGQKRETERLRARACTERGHAHLHVVWQEDDELRRACEYFGDRPDEWGVRVGPDGEPLAFDATDEEFHAAEGWKRVNVAEWVKANRPQLFIAV